MTRHGGVKGLVGGLVGAAALTGLGATIVAARRQRTSPLMLVVRNALRLRPTSFKNVDKLRAETHRRSYPVDASVPRSLGRICRISRWTHDGQDVVELTPNSGQSRWHIIYLHGGAYIYPLVGAHWSIIQKLIEATGATVTVPLYALAPENDHRRATRLAGVVYDRVASRYPNAKIAIAGDSAGGNFALTLALRRRDEAASVPDHLILISPWLDLAMRDERARQLENLDPMLAVDGLRVAGGWWAGSKDPASPEFSPLYADLKGLPSTIVFQGDHDIFVVDARSFVDRLRAEDVPFEYHELRGAFHVFLGATVTREARFAFAQIGKALR